MLELPAGFFDRELEEYRKNAEAIMSAPMEDVLSVAEQFYQKHHSESEANIVLIGPVMIAAFLRRLVAASSGLSVSYSRGVILTAETLEDCGVMAMTRREVFLGMLRKLIDAASAASMPSESSGEVSSDG